MEVILSSTNAKTHFYGKLLGVILAALTQLVATGFLLGVAVFIMRDNGSLNEMLANLNFTGIEPSFIILLLLFILAGSLFLCSLSCFMWFVGQSGRGCTKSDHASNVFDDGGLHARLDRCHK